MKFIQLQYQGNFRYLSFVVNDKYYLIDRHPSNIIGHLFFPLNWALYHKVYPITTEEYLILKEKHARASKFVIPTSLVGGATVFFNAWIRVNKIDIFKHFNTDFSMITNCILLAIGLVVAFLLLQLLYYSRRKSLQALLDRELKQPLYYKMRPHNPLAFFLHILWAWLFILFLFIIFTGIFLYLGNIVLLLVAILLAFIYLGAANGAFSAKEKWKYKIVDILLN